MRQYETMVLLSPNLTDEAVEEKISAFEKQVADGGGEVLNVDRWGKKRLAYPIKRQRHGFYYVITYRAESATVQEIERGMRLSEDTFRYMTVRMDPDLLRKLEKNAERAAAKEAEAAQSGGRGGERDDRNDRDDRPRGRRDDRD